MMHKRSLIRSTLFAPLLGLSLLGTLTPRDAHAEIIWNGDFQTGNLSQWSGTQEAASNRLQVITSEAPSGDQYSLEATVEPGDLVSNGARAEVDYTGDSPVEGDVRYYHWQSYFPTDYQTMNVWQIFTQWHQYVTGGSPPLAIMIWNDQIKLGNENNVYFWTGPLDLGMWHDFIVHVVWSVSADTGGVELWYDGQHVLPFTNVATLFPNDTVYVKQGLYRSSQITWAQTVYHAGMTIATELSDVMPATPDAGTTTDAGTGNEGGTDAGSRSADAGDKGGGTTDAGDTNPDSGDTTDAGDKGGGTTDAGDTNPNSGDTIDAGDSDHGGAPVGSGSESPPTPKHSSCNSMGGAWMILMLVAGAWLVVGRRTSRHRQGSTEG